MSVDRICPVCGGTFTVDKPSRKQKNCSHRCAYQTLKDKLLAASFTPDAIAKRADARRGSSPSGGYVKRGGRHEHRVVVEKRIGRRLRSDEIVHHDDENKRNNDDSNLILTTRADHARHHWFGKVIS